MEKAPPLTPFTPAPAHPTSLFVSFEGVEGAGKSTQSEKLKRAMEEAGMEVSVFREPGGTPFGEGLRASILKCTNDLSPLAEAYLFASSRAQLLHQEILPRLQRPKQMVIVDRYYDSSVAYQGLGQGLGPHLIAHIHGRPPLHSMPHLTFYLDTPLELGLSRMEERGQIKDYFESREKTFFEKIVCGFDWCARHYPERIVKIQGDREIQDVGQEIQRLCRDRLHG
ncbi:MAG: dTMP kinase [Bacteriovoracales bacterium]|nr:dTMP kinase [Bacteriovoracales bacterium]